MRSIHKNIVRLAALATLTINAAAQNKPFTLSKKQALEDLHWLRFSLEYVHPRLYKYDDKKTVDTRFDDLQKTIGKEISGLDFLALVAKANARVRCGHLYTIPQGALAKAISEKKVLPFYIKLISGQVFLFNNCSEWPIPDGSLLLSINGKSAARLLELMQQGIPADGYIQTRKDRLLERYFNYSFQGFDLYYYLFADRKSQFEMDYLPYGETQSKTVTLEGLSSEKRKTMLLEKYGKDEQAWFTTPSPKFELHAEKNYAVLTVSRSFFNKEADPDFDSLLSSAFRAIKEKRSVT